MSSGSMQAALISQNAMELALHKPQSDDLARHRVNPAAKGTDAPVTACSLAT